MGTDFRFLRTWVSVGIWLKPVPAVRVLEWRVEPAWWVYVPSPCEKAMKAGPGCVCQPVVPPGASVPCWNTVSHGLAIVHVIALSIDATLKRTVFVTTPPFVLT